MRSKGLKRLRGNVVNKGEDRRWRKEKGDGDSEKQERKKERHSSWSRIHDAFASQIQGFQSSSR